MKNSLPEDIVCCWCCFNFLLLLLSVSSEFLPFYLFIWFLSLCWRRSWNDCDSRICSWLPGKHWKPDWKAALGVRASLLPGGCHCQMAEGQASHMAASVWGLGGKGGWAAHHSEYRLSPAFSSPLWPCFHAQSFSFPENRPPSSCRGGQQEEVSGWVAGWRGGLWILGPFCSVYIFLNSFPVFNPAPPLTPQGSHGAYFWAFLEFNSLDLFPLLAPLCGYLAFALLLLMCYHFSSPPPQVFWSPSILLICCCVLSRFTVIVHLYFVSTVAWVGLRREWRSMYVFNLLCLIRNLFSATKILCSCFSGLRTHVN